MKSTKLVLVALLLSLVAIALASTDSAAQSMTKSDTVSLPKDTNRFYTALRDFGPVGRGGSECHTIYIKNSASAALVIKTFVSDRSDTGSWSVKPIAPIPTVLLQGEIVSIANLCFSPKNLLTTAEQNSISIDYSVNSVSDEYHISVVGKITPDSTLLPDSVLRLPCVTATMEHDLWGPVIMDGDATNTITLHNNRYDSMRVTCTDIYPDSARFFPDNEFFPVSGIKSPYILAPREQKTFTVTFSPRSNVPNVKYRFVGTLQMYVDDIAVPDPYRQRCTSFDLSMPGVAIPPTADSIATSLSAGSTDVLAMISDNSTNSHTFHFKNTGTTSLKITNVSLKNSKSFSISNITPSNTLPFTLAPTDPMSVTVDMTSGATGVYYDEVIITAEVAAAQGKGGGPASVTTMTFELQGLQKPTAAGVHTAAPQSGVLTIFPNPSRGMLSASFPGVTSARIRVLNTLGAVVAEATANEHWSWMPNVPAGVYIMQVRGTDATGKPIMATERFVVEK